jgi:hypothetical protein
MKTSNLLDALRTTPAVARAIASSMDEETLRWRPAPDAWCCAEIIGHLLDEERLDFRPRLQRLLANPELEWDPIDPPRTVIEHAHAAADVVALIDAFEAERRDSMLWLVALVSPSWGNAKRHASGRELRAGDLLASWAVHDQLHLRQLVNRRAEFLRAVAAPYSGEYAG